ncbi:hypothetical protein JCM7686_pAMI4p341 (plasmid) [Paracoccus aminophilus JCM 7686]|uniref:Uncharacterized protein n=1 Tax=Paracoccus aminophilus JCM 7686 TaxID=1367847 RepID=S5Y0H9_PARAH|nr:hypothetical protein JCM7686_pAMI4p341 [Paracoccus aminophilus JCM 7686]
MVIRAELPLAVPLVRAITGDGPERVSSPLMVWAETQGMALCHIQPGKLQQNHLGPCIFQAIETAQKIAIN